MLDFDLLLTVIASNIRGVNTWLCFLLMLHGFCFRKSSLESQFKGKCNRTSDFFPGICTNVV